MSNKVLLVGNGINSITAGYKWEDLIRELIKFVGATKIIQQINKPFPLLYEEIVLKALSKKLKKEKEVKQFISSHLATLPTNEIHKEITKMGLHSILTTNYDYCIESALGKKNNEIKNLGVITESRYNLFRYFDIEKTRIWHIHGESNAPSSITLGFEQYSGYLQHIRNYVVTGTGDGYKTLHFEPLIRRIRKGKLLNESWVEYFFTSNIYILGLTMDFVEMHLWWLLTFRARSKYNTLLPIHNKIVYFIPSPYVQTNEEKIDLLKSCDVIVHPLSYDRNNRFGYYRRALRIIKAGK